MHLDSSDTNSKSGLCWKNKIPLSGYLQQINHNMKKLLIAIIILGITFTYKVEKTFASFQQSVNSYSFTGTEKFNSDMRFGQLPADNFDNMLMNVQVNETGSSRYFDVFLAVCNNSDYSNCTNYNSYFPTSSYGDKDFWNFPTGTQYFDFNSIGFWYTTSTTTPVTPTWNGNQYVRLLAYGAGGSNNWFYGISSLSAPPTDTNNTPAFPYIQLSTVSAPLEFNYTRIIDTIPLNDAVIATSSPTTIGATIYILNSDYVDGMYLQMGFDNNTLSNGIGGSALDAWNTAFEDIEIPITSSGYSTISTTTTFTNTGLTYGSYKVIVPNSTPIVGFLFSDQTLALKTNQFTVVQKTALDLAMGSTTTALISALTTGTTTLNYLQACDFNLHFSLAECLMGLVIPSNQVMQSNFVQIRDGFLSSFPLGYVTRFVTILSGTATSSLPTISYTGSSTNPVLGAIGNIHFDPFGSLNDSANILHSAVSDTSGENVWEIMEIAVKIVIYLALTFMIIHDLTGLSKAHKRKH